jgi:hypothetical protein
VASSVNQNGDGTVTVQGAGFGPDSRVFFDGARGTQAVFSGSDGQGSLTVLPPPGANGQTAAVTVYNSDGQNSRIIASFPVPTYAYPATGAAQIFSVTPNALPAGATAMVDIVTANMNLTDAQTTIGFGSDDVQVRRVWVLGPNHAIVNVAVAANANTAQSEVSVISGMQTALAPNAFQTLPARSGVPVVAAAAPTDLTQQTATLFGSNLAGAQVWLNDNPVGVLFSNATQINFLMPGGLTPGPETLRVTTSAGTAFPVAIQIDAAPPVITGANSIASPGDLIQITVSGLDSALATNPQGRLRVTASGVDLGIQGITSAGSGYQITAAVTQSFGSQQVPLVVWADSTPSAPVTITIR